MSESIATPLAIRHSAPVYGRELTAGGHYQYSSPTPGFSNFLILGQSEGSSSGEPVVTPDSGTVAKSTATPETTTTEGTPGFGILFGIMGILVAIYSRKK
ncbi:MAG: hypothetical protein KAR85_03805 [Methanosarcinales archaeon]|nr:hypothetical protein [Methanosarcinales archaeon]